MTNVEFNKTAIFSALKDAGVSSAVLDYQGEGDSGDNPDITFHPSSPDLTVKVQLQKVERIYNQTLKEVEETIGTVERTLERALDAFLYEVINESNHAGWENGDGGGGTLTLDIASNSYELAHYDNIIHQEHSTYKG